MKLARDEILFRGVTIKGTSWSLRQGESLIKKYIDKPEIGDIIQTKLKLLDISQDKLCLPHYALSYKQRGVIEIAHDAAKDRDWLEWNFAHELWHLTGTSDEVACDDFADRMIGSRPKYRYSEAQLEQLGRERSGRRR